MLLSKLSSPGPGAGAGAGGSAAAVGAGGGGAGAATGGGTVLLTFFFFLLLALLTLGPWTLSITSLVDGAAPLFLVKWPCVGSDMMMMAVLLLGVLVCPDSAARVVLAVGGDSSANTSPKFNPNTVICRQ